MKSALKITLIALACELVQAGTAAATDAKTHKKGND